jgi:hypothetical protein
MKVKFPWLKSQMIRACMDFADMRLWELYDNMDLFVVQTPLEEPVVASIMGAGGQEYGLSVFRGPDAFRQPLMLYDKPKSAVDKINTIGFSMMYYRDMDHLEKKWLKSCNHNARKSEWVPSVISKKPGRMMEMVEKDHDVKLMLYILKGIMRAQEDGDFCPTTAGAVDSKMMTIDVSGDALDPNVRVKHRSFPGSRELLDLCNQDMLDEAPETEDAVNEAVPEEVLAAARDHIREYYMDWLDLPIPILDNKTPRQFARSKKGAQKIKMLIETIPAPTGNTDVEIPRKEMLRELGLGEKL